MTDTEFETEALLQPPEPEPTYLQIREKAARAAYTNCRGSLQQFCDFYLPQAFQGWSDANVDILTTLDNVILNGGTADREMTRGTGATTLLLAAALWAGLCEHRRAVLVICHDQHDAMQCTALINQWIAHSPHIATDFARALFKASECIRVRGRGQNLRIPFRTPTGDIIKPDLCLIDSVAGNDFAPAGDQVQELGNNLAAVRITSIER